MRLVGDLDRVENRPCNRGISAVVVGPAPASLAARTAVLWYSSNVACETVMVALATFRPLSFDRNTPILPTLLRN